MTHRVRGTRAMRTGDSNSGRRFYAAYERGMPERAYDAAYRLTPGEYHRLRSQGFSRDEVFMIANASRVTGFEPRVFADAIYRGLYARGIANEWGVDPNDLTYVAPEWRTQAWADATHESVYTRDKLNVWW